MEYKVFITDDYYYDINAACTYIENILKSPYASNRLRNRVEQLINNLHIMPRMFQIIDKYDKVRRRYRRAIANNYVMLYTVDEDDMVYVSHLYYDGRDYFNKLF